MLQAESQPGGGCPHCPALAQPPALLGTLLRVRPEKGEVLLPACRLHSPYFSLTSALSRHKHWAHNVSSYAYPLISRSPAVGAGRTWPLNLGSEMPFRAVGRIHQVFPAQHPRDSHLLATEWSAPPRLTGGCFRWCSRCGPASVPSPEVVLRGICPEALNARANTNIVLYFDLILLLVARPSR